MKNSAQCDQRKCKRWLWQQVIGPLLEYSMLLPAYEANRTCSYFLLQENKLCLGYSIISSTNIFSGFLNFLIILWCSFGTIIITLFPCGLYFATNVIFFPISISKVDFGIPANIVRGYISIPWDTNVYIHRHSDVYLWVNIRNLAHIARRKSEISQFQLWFTLSIVDRELKRVFSCQITDKLGWLHYDVSTFCRFSRTNFKLKNVSN